MNKNPIETFGDDSRDIERRLKSFGRAIECNLSITDRVLEQLSSGTTPQEDSDSSQGSHSSPLTKRGSMSSVQKFSVGALAASVLFALLYSVADSRFTFAQVVASVQKATSCSYDSRMVMRKSRASRYS